LSVPTAAGQVKPFHCGVFPQPTPSVDYAAWLHADHPLQLQYHEYWEPFGAGPIASMPLYDERFRGYGLNKQQHTRHLEALGFEFQVSLRRQLEYAPQPPCWLADPLHLACVAFMPWHSCSCGMLWYEATRADAEHVYCSVSGYLSMPCMFALCPTRCSTTSPHQPSPVCAPSPAA
jgi:hypothetical protein